MTINNRKTANHTFSIPLDVLQDLHTYVKRREMSHFVTSAIRKELSSKKDYLKSSYRIANEDLSQNEAFQDLDSTILDISYAE